KFGDSLVPHILDSLAACLSIVDNTPIAPFGTFAGSVSLIASRLNVVGQGTSSWPILSLLLIPYLIPSMDVSIYTGCSIGHDIIIVCSDVIVPRCTVFGICGYW